jgi:hypothetical protein
VRGLAHTVDAVTKALESKGVVIQADGVRLRKPHCVGKRATGCSPRLRLFSLIDYLATKLDLKSRRMLRVGKAIEQMPTVVFAD